MVNGFTHPQWFTYKQAVAFGGQVRKGEKGSKVVKYGTVEREAEGQGGNEDPKVIPFARAYTVFNADQVEWETRDHILKGYEPRNLGTESDPELDAMFIAMGIPTETHEKPTAYYSPQQDRVFLPPVETFHEVAEFYATVSHEYVHATGHRRRLDRVLSAKREAYAFEELIAELGAAMVCGFLGIAADINQSAAYIESWLKALRNDNRMIFRAAASAQKAADLLLDAAERGAGEQGTPPVMIAAE
jgi:antirestriction protein ArdC